MTHPLTELGREQAYNSGEALKELVDGLSSSVEGGVERVVFAASPFRRAVETAELAAKGLQDRMAESPVDYTVTAPILRISQFRERFFGRLDGLPLSTYSYVWPV